MISDILNKEYRFCDFKEREKSVFYKEIDLDKLLIGDLKVEKDDLIKVIEPDIL